VVLLSCKLNLVKKKSEKTIEGEQSFMLGLFAILMVTTISGLAGTYLEKLLKDAKSTIWMRNVQLSMYGSVLAFGALWWNDWPKVQQNGLLGGYNSITWLVVADQAFGGLVVAVVVKYADTILKGFATSVAIIVAGILSAMILDFFPSLNFLIGTVLVIIAVLLYNRPEK